MTGEEASVLLASDAWAQVVELVMEADDEDGDEDSIETRAKALESAELVLYRAVLTWRRSRRQ
jgi:hypothetical protein